MKRIVFLFALLYGATLMAQNKAVAVTEVVDKEDKVSYATEIMVRTSLTATISMKQGYTAYDRVDLQSIMSEQNFQRTGLVDDATIKRLGEMTGASLILIPEVAMSDDGKIYVAVKMLDVTTAQTMMATGQLMESSSSAVEEGCLSLVKKILDEGSTTTNTTSTAEPVTLFGYLHVFPTDIGEFQTLPAQLLSAINGHAQYGYDTWRLPTAEELSIMRANSHLIPNFKNAEYLCSDSSNEGLARLVTTEPTRDQREIARYKAICNLLNLKTDDSWIRLEDERIIYRCISAFAVFDNRGVIVEYPTAEIPTKAQLLSLFDITSRSGYYVSINSYNNDICWSMDINGDQLVYTVDRLGSESYSYLRKNYKYNYEVFVIQFYRYPNEEIIRQEMQKHY